MKLVKQSKEILIFFSVLTPDRMGAMQPRHHLWRWGTGGGGDGGYRRKAPYFLWYGGSCSSKIVFPYDACADPLYNVH